MRYRAGSVKDQRLFGQHDSHWIAKASPGEGHVLIFNNGLKRAGGAYSTVDEIVLPIDAEGKYERTPEKPFGPDKAVWSYAAPRRIDFYAPFISGAQRLPNGNTLICSGTNGTIFEVTPQCEIVWKYVNPEQAGPPFVGFPAGLPKLGKILPPFLEGFLNLTAGQKQELTAAEEELASKLDKLLTRDQKRNYKEKPAGFIDFAPPGQLMAASVQDCLKLTADQKKELAVLQHDAGDILARHSRPTAEEASQRYARVCESICDRSPARRSFRRHAVRWRSSSGRSSWGWRPSGWPRPVPGIRSTGSAGMFRALRYSPDYSGLVGKDLTPGKTIEELQQKHPPAKSLKDSPKLPAAG